MVELCSCRFIILFTTRAPVYLLYKIRVQKQSGQRVNFINVISVKTIFLRFENLLYQIFMICIFKLLLARMIVVLIRRGHILAIRKIECLPAYLHLLSTTDSGTFTIGQSRFKHVYHTTKTIKELQSRRALAVASVSILFLHCPVHLTINGNNIFFK